MNLYLTADAIGTETGGGVVTKHEYAALREFSGEDGIERLSRPDLECHADEPWKWDLRASEILANRTKYDLPKLCHIYSGTWPRTVKMLRGAGCKVAVTIAAHDRHVSRREHELLGLSFPYPHLTDEVLWWRYIDGYRNADVIVCPSTVAEQTVRGYGKDFVSKRIVVIPHGCELPNVVKPLPSTLTVGYLGSYGADKGVRYLLEAWKKLNSKTAILMLGGRDSTHPYVQELIRRYGGGNIWCRGWMKNVSDFYNDCTIYVQPSASEGQGIEVLEAMAHGRATLCSMGAGASDVVPAVCRFKACDSDDLATALEAWFPAKELQEDGEFFRKKASEYTWDKIRQRYIDLWRSMV